MESNRNWEFIKDFYQVNFNLDDKLVDLMASSDVILMSVSGASNESIAKTLDVDVSVVQEILSTVIDFDGWLTDLSINPYYIFTNDRISKVNDNYSSFLHDVLRSSADTNTSSEIETMYRICSAYYEIQIRIENEWI